MQFNFHLNNSQNITLQLVVDNACDLSTPSFRCICCLVVLWQLDRQSGLDSGIVTNTQQLLAYLTLIHTQEDMDIMHAKYQQSNIHRSKCFDPCRASPVQAACGHRTYPLLHPSQDGTSVLWQSFGGPLGAVQLALAAMRAAAGLPLATCSMPQLSLLCRYDWLPCLVQ